MEKLKVFFHNHEYRHTLRDVAASKPKTYIKVLVALMNKGLDPSGFSKAHTKVISDVLQVTCDSICKHEGEK